MADTSATDKAASLAVTKHLLHTYGMLIILLLLFLGLSVSVDGFMSMRTVLSIMEQVSMFGIISIGVTFAIITCGIDLSSGAVVALSAVMAAMLIWPLFGTTNQLMAGLTLLVVTVMLLKAGRKVWFTLLPMAFLLFVSIVALLLQLRTFYTDGNWLLVVLDLVILACSILASLECISVLKQNWGSRNRSGVEAA